MKKALLKVAVMLLCLAGVTPAMAQFNLKKAVGGAVKAAKAVTLTDEQMTEYVKEYIDWMNWSGAKRLTEGNGLGQFLKSN